MAKAMSKTEGPKPPSGGIPIPKSRRGTKAFFADVAREIKKVTWPTRSETNRMTGIVLAVCALVVGILTTLSLVVGTIMSIISTGKV